MSEEPTLPTLSTKRLTLRMLDEGDVDALFRMLSDPEVMRYWSRPPIENREEAESFVENSHEGFLERRYFQWGILDKESDAFLGVCTLFELDRQNRRSEVGFMLARRFWRRGLMKEALEGLFDFAFGPMKMHRIEGDVDPRNERCLATMEKLGFQREGYARQRWLVGEEVQDSVLLGLLASDWRAMVEAESQVEAAGPDA